MDAHCPGRGHAISVRFYHLVFAANDGQSMLDVRQVVLGDGQMLDDGQDGPVPSVSYAFSFRQQLR